MTAIAHRLTAVAASVGLITGGLALVSGPVSAEGPISCAVIGEAGVIPLTFAQPVVDEEGLTAIFENVGVVDEQPIDARATVAAIDGAEIEFETSDLDEAVVRLTRSADADLAADADADLSATVTWEFYASSDSESPVPVLSSWVIGDLGADRTSLSIPKNDLHAVQSVTAEAISIDATVDPVIVTRADAEPSVVQLDFGRLSSLTITYHLGPETDGAHFTHTANGDVAFAEPTTCVGVADHDDDGITDIEDPDDDNDGISDLAEGDADTDGDGVPDAKDLDADNDGIGDVTEQSSSAESVDADRDGVPNRLDLDADGDGIADADEAGHGVVATDGMIPGPYGANGMADAVETDDATDGTIGTENYTLLDADGGTVDFLENADLELVSITSASAAPGEQATITMSLRNNGIGGAGDVTLAHSLPTGASLDVADSPGCSVVAGEVHCVIAGTIADGATPWVSFVLDTSPSVAAGLEATTARIAAHSTPDADSTNNEATATFEFLAPMADIEITSVSSPTVTPGSATVATIDYRNNGPSDNRGFQLRHSVPVGATLDPLDTTDGCAVVADDVICTVDAPLSPAAVGSIVLAFDVAEGTEIGEQRVAVSVEDQRPLDDDTGNDQFDTAFEVTDLAVSDLAVAVTDPPESITPGATGVVTIAVTNNGPSQSPDTMLAYVLPTGVDLDSDTVLPDGCTETVGNTVTCATGTVNNGDTVRLVVPILVPADAVGPADLADGAATAGSASNTDPDLANNVDINSTIVVGEPKADLAVSFGTFPILQPGEFDPHASGLPIDTDGIPDHRDLDTDGDGLSDAVESDNGTPIDTDRDGTPDHRDLDADGDGFGDAVERGSGSTPADTDGDGVPDFQDIDADNDGFSDRDELVFGEPSPDDDGDGIPNRSDPDVSGITGVIVDAFDQPITDAKVTITTADGARHETTTDALGRYLFVSSPDAALAPGVVSVQAELANGSTVADETAIVPGLTAEQDFVAEPGVLALTGSSHTVFNTALVLLSAGTLLVLFSSRRSRAELRR